MAPSTTTFALIAARQAGSSATTPTGDNATTVPTCVTTCMAQGDTAGCSGPDDYACLCGSTVFSNSVAVCWVAQCKSEEITIGLRYSSGICDSITSGGNGTIGGNGSPAPVLTGTPHIFQDAFVNVQAIMSSVCAAVLAIAILLGFLACRSRIRAEREASDKSTWSGVATYAEAKHGNKSQILSQGGINPMQSRTFDPAASEFDIPISFSSLGAGVGPYANASTSSDRSRAGPSGTGRSVNRGFTNRLTLEEEIEMSVHTSSSCSPVTPSTGRDEKFRGIADTAEPSPTASSFRTQQEDEVGFRQIGVAANSTTELTPKTDHGEFEKARGPRI